MKFVCDKCGLCCSHLKDFGDAYASLDRGDGVCINFDSKTNTCTIYQDRPLICRVEEGYKAFFTGVSYKTYIKQTIRGCEILKKFYGNTK